MVTIVSFIGILITLSLAIKYKGIDFLRAYALFAMFLFSTSWVMADDAISILLLLCFVLNIVLFIGILLLEG